jgi:TonB family protein
MREINDRPEVWPFILLSIILHLAIVFLLYRTASVPTFQEKVVEIVPIMEEGKVRDFRIADIDRPAVEEKPQRAKFVGQYDSAVPKEQVANGRVGTGESGDGRKKSPVARKEEAPKVKTKGASRRDLYSFDKKVFEEKRPAALGRGESGDPSGDFFPDFKRANKTYLNVLRYPDVDYFVRLKRAFRMTFNPEPSLRDHFAYTSVTRGSVEVVLGVSVDKGGGIAELFVFRSSGIPAYDDEALRTVRSSSPFSAPPDKFVDDDGLLRMSWTFTVYL